MDSNVTPHDVRRWERRKNGKLKNNNSAKRPNSTSKKKQKKNK